MNHFDVVVHASRKALLEADDHQKVAQALREIAEKLTEADADAARIVQLTEQLKAADEKARKLEQTLDKVGFDFQFYEVGLAMSEQSDDADRPDSLFETLKQRLKCAGIDHLAIDASGTAKRLLAPEDAASPRLVEPEPKESEG